MHESGSSVEDEDSDEEISSAEPCGSDPEDMESGAFFDYIQKQTKIAERERKYVLKKLKAKSRVGSIFFDKVQRVVAAVQRDTGKYDYLIEWDYNSRDKLKPTTSLVKGAHFVFAKPLLFRRCVEAQYVEKCLALNASPTGAMIAAVPVICPSTSNAGAGERGSVDIDGKVIKSCEY